MGINRSYWSNLQAFSVRVLQATIKNKNKKANSKQKQTTLKKMQQQAKKKQKYKNEQQAKTNKQIAFELTQALDDVRPECKQTTSK